MKFGFTFLLFCWMHLGYSQTTEFVYKNSLDSSYNCYLTILPDTGKIKGLIVRDYSSLPPRNNQMASRYQWKDLALKQGLAIVYTVSSKFKPELYYNDSGLYILDSLIHEVVQKHSIPKDNIFIGGISASGTRALKYAQFCEKGQSNFGLKVNGVFSVDSPLDYERFYLSALRHKHLFRAGMLSEAEMMIRVFPEKLGGTPDTALVNYQSASVFSASDFTGGNAINLMNTATIFFHEPDIDWWTQERGATYYDINSYDIAGLYNFMLFNEHKDVELITTSGKGFDKNGNRKCHSWTIVDEEYLIKWIITRLK